MTAGLLEDTVLDADEVQDRLLREMNAAHLHASNRYPDNAPKRSALELEELRRRLREFAAEVHIHGEEGNRMLDWLHSVSPGVQWVRKGGEFRGAVHGGRADMALKRVRRLAERLKLPQADPSPGWLVWSGLVDSWQVRVYAPDLGRA